MTEREKPIQEAIRAYLALERDLACWRNNVGVAKFGSSIVRYGLCVGSSDLIGILGPAGRMIALEVKVPGGAPTDEQTRFLERVRSHGGFASVVHSVTEVRATIARARAGMY